jgi:hypothetical protein
VSKVSPRAELKDLKLISPAQCFPYAPPRGKIKEDPLANFEQGHEESDHH